MLLSNRVSIITGSAQGIGAAIAHKLAKEGSRVVLVDLIEKGIKKVCSDIRDAGGEALYCPIDVTDKQQIQKMVQQVITTWDRIDILVNNAGAIDNRQISDMPEEAWDKIINVNLKSAFLCIQAVVDYMKKQGYGRIVNISSGSAYGAITPGQSNYSSAKAGLLGLTKTLANELGPHNIYINAVAPGFVETEMTRVTAKLQGIDFEEFKTQRAKTLALRRVAQPEDVAKAVCFLASEEASYIIGEVIHLFGNPAQG